MTTFVSHKKAAAARLVTIEALQARIAQLEAALRLCLRELDDINKMDLAGSDAKVFCGDEFHEALAAGHSALETGEKHD